MLTSIGPDLAPYAVIGFALLALATWLMALDAGSPVNRAFALFLALRGTSTLSGVGLEGAAGPAAASAFFALGVYAVIAANFAIVYFLSIYPRPRGPFGSTRGGPWLLFGLSLVPLAWFAIDHGAFIAFTPDGPIRGPLFLFGGLIRPMFATAAVVLALDYLRLPRGSKGYSMFMIAAAFALIAMVNGTMFLGNIWSTYDEAGWQGISASFQGMAGANNILAALALPLGLLAVIIMALAMRHEASDKTLQEARRFITIAVPLAIITAAAARYAGEVGREDVRELTLGVWGLIMPAMITYALLRFSLFNVDVRLKAGVRRAIVVAAFTVTFFIVTEAAEGVLQVNQSSAVGIIGAALIALAARPLHALATRAADALMPDTKPIAHMSLAERQEMYHQQYLLVEHDGILTTKERRMLDGLGAALGFDADEATRLEQLEFTYAPHEPVALPPQDTSRSVGRRMAAAGITAIAFGATSQTLELLVPASDFILGLFAAAIIAALLGPIERLTAGRQRPADGPSIEAFEEAVDQALIDGELDRRDRLYLSALAERLGIDARTRRRLLRQGLATHNVPRKLRAMFT